MSGKKSSFVSLTQEQYQTLHEHFIKRLFLHSDESTPNPDITSIFQNQVEEGNKQSQDREKSFRTLTSQFNQHIRDIELETSSAIDQAEIQLTQKLIDQSDAVENQMMDYLEDHLQTFNNTLLANHHQQQSQISKMRRQMASMRRTEEDRASLAEEWIRNTHDLITFIDTSYRHTQFAPSRLVILIEDLDQAVQNFDLGLYEAALVNSQNIYRRASELRVAMERDEKQWNICYSIALKKINQLMEKIQNQKEFNYQSENNKEKQKFDLEFWSKGKWGELWQKAKRYKTQLVEHPEQLSIADLRIWITDTFQQFDFELDSIVNDAIRDLINSQIRTNIADMVMQALQKQGYTLDNSEFSGKDVRQSFFFTARNIAGNAIRVLVNPGEAEKNELQLEAIDQRPQTEYFLKRRADEIAHSLQKVGLSIDGFTQKVESTYDQPRQKALSIAERKSQYGLH